MPLSKKVKNLLLRTCEKYGVSSDLIDTAQIDPSLTYDEVKPVIEEMVSLLSPEYHPPPIREAKRVGNEIFKSQMEEVTIALREAIVRVRKDSKLGLRDKFRRLGIHAEYLESDAKVLMAEERKIEREGGTIDYRDVLNVLEKQKEIIKSTMEAFREYPYILTLIKEAENHIMQGIELAKLKITRAPKPINLSFTLYSVSPEAYYEATATQPHGLTKVSVAVLRASCALADAYKKGIEKEF